jgi:hypothetical protein
VHAHSVRPALAWPVPRDARLIAHERAVAPRAARAARQRVRAPDVVREAEPRLRRQVVRAPGARARRSRAERRDVRVHVRVVSEYVGVSEEWRTGAVHDCTGDARARKHASVVSLLQHRLR